MIRRIACLLMLALVAASDTSCEDHCAKSTCASLNGRLSGECGGCDATILCNPSAADWHADEVKEDK